MVEAATATGCKVKDIRYLCPAERKKARRVANEIWGKCWELLDGEDATPVLGIGNSSIAAIFIHSEKTLKTNGVEGVYLEIDVSETDYGEDGNRITYDECFCFHSSNGGYVTIQTFPHSSEKVLDVHEANKKELKEVLNVIDKKRNFEREELCKKLFNL